MSPPPTAIQPTRAALDCLYARYNHARWISPDPLELVLRYPEPEDREIAGLLAAGFAYGNVASIVRNARAALDRMGPSPRAWLENASPGALAHAFAGCGHRWTRPADIAALLRGAKGLIAAEGTLGRAFLRRLHRRDPDVMPALAGWASALRAHGGFDRNSLLGDPERGSACKRLHMYLRWMVREDAVDPGCWKGISPALLLYPVDVHVHRVCSEMGLTGRRAADLATAREITEGFRRIRPRDPVRYDFALSRLGIRRNADSLLSTG